MGVSTCSCPPPPPPPAGAHGHQHTCVIGTLGKEAARKATPIQNAPNIATAEEITKSSDDTNVGVKL